MMGKIALVLLLCAALGCFEPLARADLVGELSPGYEQIEKWLQGCGGTRYSEVMGMASEYFELNGKSMDEDLRDAWRQFLAMPTAKCDEEGREILDANFEDSGSRLLRADINSRVGRIVYHYYGKNGFDCLRNFRRDFEKGIKNLDIPSSELERLAIGSRKLQELMNAHTFDQTRQAVDLIKSMSYYDFTNQFYDRIADHPDEYKSLMPYLSRIPLVDRKLKVNRSAIKRMLESIVKSCKTFVAHASGALDRFQANFQTRILKVGSYSQFFRGMAIREFCGRFIKSDLDNITQGLTNTLVREHPL